MTADRLSFQNIKHDFTSKEMISIQDYQVGTTMPSLSGNPNGTGARIEKDYV